MSTVSDKTIREIATRAGVDRADAAFVLLAAAELGHLSDKRLEQAAGREITHPAA